MLRAIVDVNLCKFLSQDVPLFKVCSWPVQVFEIVPGVALLTLCTWLVNNGASPLNNVASQNAFCFVLQPSW